MNPNKQKTLYTILAFLMINSLACLGTSILKDPEVREVVGDPIIKRPTPTSFNDLTDEGEAEFQPYLGTTQSELIAVEHIPGITNCPPTDVDLSPDAEVKYEIEGNILTATDEMGSRDYEYTGPNSNRFSRQLPDGSAESISFETINGLKMVNLRRYLSGGNPVDVDSLCYDQYSQLSSGTEELLESVADAILVEQCLATPNMYQVEFTNISDEYSNDSKTVCLGDFILQNLSNENISLRYYHIFDDGTKHTEEWTYLHISLDPGEKTERSIGSQIWTDGTSTTDTLTKLIVVRSSLECTNLIRDENVSIWIEYAVPLNDPCK